MIHLFSEPRREDEKTILVNIHIPELAAIEYASSFMA